MQIRIAFPDDLNFIKGAYEQARAFMQANGNATQWPDGYPGRIDAEEDIARGHCFVVTDKAALQSWVWVEASRPPAMRSIRSL